MREDMNHLDTQRVPMKQLTIATIVGAVIALAVITVAVMKSAGLTV
tara:strand:+ start:917 stop:1054 length:138 start_codon:yes stop_codon:yes gene_type:complete